MGKKSLSMHISLPEVFVSHASIAPYVSKGVKKLGSRVYTTNLKEDPRALTRRYAWFLVEELFPGAIVVDRTALEHRPAEDGSIFIISKKKRGLKLPGLVIRPRKGIGPLEEDRPFMGRLYLSCPARAYLENMRKSRTRAGAVSRTLSRKEIEEKLELLLQLSGVEALQKIREESRKLAPALGLPKEFKALDSLIGALLGTRKANLTSLLAIARTENQPYDPKRLDLFQSLFETLKSVPLKDCKVRYPGSALPFFEAYFSNFIEGTEFEVSEAAQIIFEGKIPKDRPEDAHDILGTFQLTSDDSEMKKTPSNAEELLYLLKSRHARLMQGRPEMKPGEFKSVQNKAGSTFFVAPELVEGTLKQGFKWFMGLDTPFQRAVFMMFLISEVHPFADGNGRCARVMMNCELAAGDQARIIIPTVYRNNYLASLKTISHHGKVEALIRVLDFAQNYTSLIDWSSFKKAQKMLQLTHAFEDPNTAEVLGVRLILPG
jgi:hypothetical protein